MMKGQIEVSMKGLFKTLYIKILSLLNETNVNKNVSRIDFISSMMITYFSMIIITESNFSSKIIGTS